MLLLGSKPHTFFGTTICYAHMQAVGMVNDHIVTCFRYPAILFCWIPMVNQLRPLERSNAADGDPSTYRVVHSAKPGEGWRPLLEQRIIEGDASLCV